MNRSPPEHPILNDMIDLYYWPTPNGHKISIMLEECDLDYTIVRMDIGAGDQFSKEFLRICPNNRMPAIIDHDNDISVFEGGAILFYLAEKAGMLLPQDTRGRNEVMQWLFWQAAGLGPMAGQYSHFFNYAEDKITYALERYANEYDRLLAVMDVRLRDRAYLAGDYSIADIASYPWVAPAPRFGIELDKFANLSRWIEAIGARSAVVKGMDIGSDWKRDESRSESARALLFGQNAETVFNAFKAAEE
jgi:GST-like protein